MPGSGKAHHPQQLRISDWLTTANATDVIIAVVIVVIVAGGADFDGSIWWIDLVVGGENEINITNIHR